MSFDLKEFGASLAKIGLPLLGMALPIPGGAAIGSALAGMIGSPSGKPEDILATLTASADARLKAQQFEETHQETLLKIAADQEVADYQTEVADRTSARAREVALRDNMPGVLAIVVIVASIGLGAAVVMGWGATRDATVAGTLGIVIGYVFNEAKAVLSYYFGSSRGSDQKSQVIADIAKAP